MTQGTVRPSQISDAISKIVAIIEALPAEHHAQIMRGVEVVLGVSAQVAPRTPPAPAAPPVPPLSDERELPLEERAAKFDELPTLLGKRAQHWARRYGVSAAELERVFHVHDGGVDVIASVTAGSKREGALCCYLLTGVKALLRSDEARFQEAEAVDLCREQLLYDTANHAAYRTSFPPKVVGDKHNGWSLPAPGLEAAAQLVKRLAE